MAKIASSFKCMVCKQPLNFPKDTSIVDFVIMLLQFHKMHDLCENLGTQSSLPQKEQKTKKLKK